MDNTELGILIIIAAAGFFIAAVIDYEVRKWKREHGVKDKSNLNTGKRNRSSDDVIYNSLDDNHKRLVDKKIYDSTSFEEEELEDDDYYNEDLD